MSQDDTPVIEPATRYRPPPVPVPVPEGKSPFLPLTLLAVALVGWLAFQATQLVVERQQIAQAHLALDPQEQNATKLRASLDAVATSTARLAGDGNANARVIVDELRQRGITINPAGAAASAPR